MYIISNIGAFGEGVYKIGMTRRLEPMDRIDELGDASVPFKFDVHAMIFSNDAPKLEAVLHSTFADFRLNMVNNRREFFRASLDEIKRVIRENHDNTVEFTEIPEAQQYRESLLMAQQRPALAEQSA
ncbi:MAG: GIY-YIG nuclease family protein [Oscillospiraceae bacterium]|nr:GIY-YIG nuclease family protein [Oscillospiraceae bacterium]